LTPSNSVPTDATLSTATDPPPRSPSPTPHDRSLQGRTSSPYPRTATAFRSQDAPEPTSAIGPAFRLTVLADRQPGSALTALCRRGGGCAGSTPRHDMPIGEMAFLFGLGVVYASAYRLIDKHRGAVATAHPDRGVVQQPRGWRLRAAPGLDRRVHRGPRGHGSGDLAGLPPPAPYEHAAPHVRLTRLRASPQAGWLASGWRTNVRTTRWFSWSAVGSRPTRAWRNWQTRWVLVPLDGGIGPSHRMLRNAV
jgi:hypothetical protein